LNLPAVGGLIASPRIHQTERRRPVDGIDEITLQVQEATAIRLLLNEARHEELNLATTRAREWVDRFEGHERHRAVRQAKCLLVSCLAVTGHDTEALSAALSDGGHVRRAPAGPVPPR
jgi:hypothetical protein